MLTGHSIAPAATTAGIPGWVLQGDLLQSLGSRDVSTVRHFSGA